MISAVRIFPYFLVRVCGGELAEFEKMRVDRVMDLAGRLKDLENELTEIKNRISDRLYEQISRCTDKKEQMRLIHLRRDVYNLRPVKGMEEYGRLLNGREWTRGEAEKIYLEEMNEGKRRLLRMADNEGFLKGLVLSSLSLYGDRKRPKAELGMVKYLARFCTKASPFSTLTSVGWGEIRYGSRWRLPGRKKKQFVRVNNLAGRYLGRLVLENRDAAREAPLRLNETVRLEGGEWAFLINDYNREAIQRIETMPALEILHKAAGRNRGLSVGKLVKICQEKNLFSEPAEVTEEFVWDLVDLGFFSLDPIETEESRRVMDLVEKKADSIAIVSASGRANLIRKVFTQYKDLSRQLYTEAGLPESGLKTFEDGYIALRKEASSVSDRGIFKRRPIAGFELKKEQLYYEDCVIPDGGEASYGEVMPIVESLSGFLRPILSEGARDTHRRLRAYFCRYYGTGATVPLLVFHERYLKRRKRGKRKNRVFEDYCKRAGDRILKRAAKGSEEVEIKQEDLGCRDGGKMSLAAYVQLFRSEGELRGVFNELNGGFGRSFSRFLPMLDRRITRKLREENKQGYTGMMLAENNDASVFNANIHPPLLEYEIRMPGSTGHVPVRRQLPVGELVVADNPQERQLELREKKSGRRIQIFDLGFEGHAGRSELFELLSYFGPIGGLADPNRLRRYLHWNEEEGIIKFPRVYFDQKLVVWRKGWLVTRRALPFMTGKETEAGYFLRVNRWRISGKLPERVFVRLIHNMEDTGEIRNRKNSADDHKPQYIDFANPFLVKLFGKMIKKAIKTLWIEEFLPGPDQLLKFGGKKCVSEFVFQWEG